jgi:glucose-6-phosphate isomerase
MPSAAELMARFDVLGGSIDGGEQVVRRLSDVAEIFADRAALREILGAGNPIVYTVSSLQQTTGEGELHCGLGTIMPGRVGREYFMTKGHFHTFRPAAEFYIGLRGKGIMLLEGENGTESSWCGLGPECLVHVPGNMAHRTVNTGDEPLVYLGIYPARAGHDYGPIAARNFASVVVAATDGPHVITRDRYLASLSEKP